MKKIKTQKEYNNSNPNEPMVVEPIEENGITINSIKGIVYPKQGIIKKGRITICVENIPVKEILLKAIPWWKGGGCSVSLVLKGLNDKDTGWIEAKDNSVKAVATERLEVGDVVVVDYGEQTTVRRAMLKDAE